MELVARLEFHCEGLVVLGLDRLGDVHLRGSRLGVVVHQLRVMASNRLPPHTSLVLAGISGFCGVQLESRPRRRLASGACRTRLWLRTPATTRRRNESEGRDSYSGHPASSSTHPMSSSYMPRRWGVQSDVGSVGTSHDETVLGHQTNTHKTCGSARGNTQHDCDLCRDELMDRGSRSLRPTHGS